MRRQCPNTYRRVPCGLLSLFVLTSIALAGAPIDSQVARDESLLKKFGFEPNVVGIEQLLRSLTPDAIDAREIEQLLDQLDDPQFTVREAATKALINLPRVPADLLRKATESNDVEVRFRAKLVLDSRATQEQRWNVIRTRVAAAGLRLIPSKRLSISLKLLLDSILHLPGEAEHQACVNAILTTAQSKDVKLLQSVLRSGKEPVQIVVLRTLPRIAPAVALDSLPTYTRSDNRQIAFAALHGLAEIGDRRCLDQLVKNLDAQDRFTSARSLQLLRAISGENFGLNLFADRSEQTESRLAWDKWLAERRKAVPRTAPNRYTPLLLRPLAESIELGLIAHYTMDQDEAGKLADASPKHHHGSIHGVYRFVDGPHGKALRLEGAGSAQPQGGHAAIPFIDFNKLKAFTVALWVKHERLSYDHGEAFICYGCDQGTTFKGSLCIGTFFDQIHFRVGDGMLVIPHEKADHDRWVHYAMAFSDGHLRVYKDGILANESAIVVNVHGNKAALGRHWWTGGSQSSTRFIGALDDARVFERALTNEQIKALAKP